MINKFVLQGRMVRDVELRYTSNGTPVASFTVAWSEKYKDTERQLFMPCTVWRSAAENASRYYHKGQELVVEGYLTSRKWQDKDGHNRETIELNVERMHFCGPKRDGYGSQAYAGTQTASDYPFLEEDESELPFSSGLCFP